MEMITPNCVQWHNIKYQMTSYFRNSEMIVVTNEWGCGQFVGNYSYGMDGRMCIGKYNNSMTNTLQ